MHKKLLLITALASLICHANAQISYNNDCLNIGNADPQSSYELNVGDMSGFNWTDSFRRFFRIDMLGTYPQIYSSNNRIRFYNTSTATYNNVYVGRVYSMDISINSISPLNDGLESVCGLNPIVIYQGEENEGARKFGFSDETIEESPELFERDDEGLVLYNNANLITLLVKSVQELNEEISSNGNKLEKLTIKNK